MSQLISDGKEIDKIFNAALSSLKKSILGEGIKVTLKIIIKLFIPDRVLNFLKKRQTIQHGSGVDANFCSDDALNKIRFSVLSFPEVYNNTNK